MLRPGNKIWLLVLMIISQIMLTGLLVYWLRSQWFDEKESIMKDLNQQFRESVDQVMDSMLVKHLIVPVLNDSSGNADHLISFNKKTSSSAINPNHHITAIFNEKGGNKEATVTISVSDTSKTEQKENFAFSTYDSTKKTMLLRSVKLIINHTGDSLGEWSQFNHMVSAFPDTTLLKKLFESKLGYPPHKYYIKWVSDTAKSVLADKSRVMNFKSNIFEKPFNAEIMHYQKIILKGISPQILFALFLLIFTGTAFFFTYRSLRKMEALNTLRNDFIGNISHELKTPVSTVTVALEALKNFDRIKDPAKSNEYLDIAYKEMKRLDQLISQVLNTSILENQSQYLNPEETDIVRLTEEVLASMQVRFLQRDANVTFNTTEKSCILYLDRLHIQGVLINILDNSLKYGAGDPQITVSIYLKSTEVHISIRDNGPGIPDEYLSKVFDKFFRVPKGDTHDVKGYGLGLSFADLVMKQHSGSVSVRNLNEGGCEFTLIFPKNKS